VSSPFLDVCVILLQMLQDEHLTKEKIIDSLYKVMCTGTTSLSDNRVTNNDYFKRRVLGFRAEMEFEQTVKESSKFSFLEGGMVFSSKLDGSNNMKNDFLYVTFDSQPPEKYEFIYRQMAQWNEVRKLIYVKINLDKWSEEEFLVKENNNKKTTNILTPDYEFYSFDISIGFSKANSNDFSSILSMGRERKNNTPVFPLRKREQFDYFNEYSLDTLKKIYAERYFVDHKKRSVVMHMIDFDGFITDEDKTLIVEIKEKSHIIDKKNPYDKNKWAYGWDTRRLLWYQYIQQKIGFNVLYNIRQIDNRHDRNFVRWDSILLSNFLKGVSWSSVRSGGGGEDTLTVPYLHFGELKDLLD